MLHIKKSKDLDLRRFGKNTYQEDIQDASTKGYNEGYQDGITAGKYDYVDLGLPSGTLWATRNIGAKSPEDFGDYFAWGETVSKTIPIDDWNWSNYAFGGPRNFTKYNTTDNKTTLDPEDDAAHVVMGGAWHMPTAEQVEELLDNTTYEPSTVNGVRGMLVTSTINENTVFFPFNWPAEDLDGAEALGLWTSSLDPDDDTLINAVNMEGETDSLYSISNIRCSGMPVRGVIGGTEESTTYGLADALTTVLAWDYQDHGSGTATHEKPDAFLVIAQYSIDENGIYYLKEVEKSGQNYLVPEFNGHPSNMNYVSVFTADQLNNYPIIGTSTEADLYDVNSNTDWNTLIYPLYEVKQRGYWFSLEGLRISYVKICRDGVIISSANEGVGSEILDHDVVKKQILVEPGSIFNNEEDLIFDILIPMESGSNEEEHS